jgi:transcription initiation factor IIE alpha subunit
MQRNVEKKLEWRNGEKSKQIEIAKKLLKMEMSIEQIVEATGLKKEEIEKLQ